MFRDYLDLLKKVDDFTNNLKAKHNEKITCHSGCSKCCITGITVWKIEFDHLQTNSPSYKLTSPPDDSSRCKFLNANGLCSIYKIRPLVCRLWGLPLMIGPDTADSLHKLDSSITKNGSGSVLMCCDLNFDGDISKAALPANDLLNADLVLTTLAAINHVYCEKFDSDVTKRFSIESII
ncbi:MAG: YkgJ family cysteine cluster protein [Deltaproteobacteria bacterium]|jgi:hypothetical protein|nr:YkgJ family cysteine cluster protein [Deltaproteobacteria bacterium]